MAVRRRRNPFFTAREGEVIALISCGARPRNIAIDLCISRQTAYVHMRNIAGKLHLSSRSCKAIAVAMGEKNLIE